MGENVIEIKDGAFSNCYSLLEIRLVDKVKDIGDRAFEGCKSLKNVVIGNVVEVISPSAFNNCEKLVNVVLGSNIKFIDSGAFRNTRIENMYINSQNPPKLHSLAFDKSWSSVQDNLRILYVPKGTLNVYKSSDWRYYFDGIKEMD